MRRALLSVFDKDRLLEVAAALARSGVEMVSTGSTAGRIAAAGLPVTAVEDVTGFPECLDGRVKTLHPAVHAGLLADQRRGTHRAQLVELGIAPFDLVVSNLYPFAETVASGASAEECVEQVDIGGPAMVRAAAKNYASVAVVTSPDQYDDLLAALAGGGFTLEQRQRLAAEAFAAIASYDVVIASWFASETAGSDSPLPDFAGVALQRTAVLRYGENPHQQAALYADPSGPGGVAQAEQLQGKEMSYNNYVDAQAAWRAAYGFGEPAVAIIKHTNPCGLAVGDDIAQAHAKAHRCDPVSAFGGVVAANRTVTAALAEQLADIFTEVLLAPEFESDALDLLQRKKSLRLMRCRAPSGDALEWRAIGGGALVQTPDRVDAPGDDPASWTLACGPALDDAGLADLAFAWRACRWVKSNAILLAADRASIGIGMGQVNRVDSARLAVARAGSRAAGSVAASDAFFPFPDGVEVLAEGGVRAVVQPGGSVRDEEVVACAEEAGLSMYLTGARHFYH